MEIIPAILPKDFKEIEEKVFSVKGLAPMVQVDICDGKYVQNTTWPYKKKDQNFEDIICENRGMPFWENVNYEFDLMIKDPTDNNVREWLSAGATRIVLHEGSSADLSPVISILFGLVDIGLALNINTPLENIEKYKEKISYIQLMGITKIGFQGQAFDFRVLEKASAIRGSIIDMLIAAKSGHTAGPLDMADIFSYLYFHALKYDPKNPNWPYRDRVVLSNGHICPVLYATMAHAGYFSPHELLPL